MGIALIVDDSGLARMMIKKCLEMADKENHYKILEAGDGKLALDILQNQEVSLVISDLNMPNLTGEELLRQVMGMEQYRQLPIILISSKVNDAKTQELIQLGARVVLKKPITPPHLIQALADINFSQG